MKEVNKGILDNDMVISAENIQKMGEVIALTCIKTVIVRSGKELNYLYVKLIDDINHSKNSTKPFSVFGCAKKHKLSRLVFLPVLNNFTLNCTALPHSGISVVNSVRTPLYSLFYRLVSVVHKIFKQDCIFWCLLSYPIL